MMGRGPMPKKKYHTAYRPCDVSDWMVNVLDNLVF